MARRRRADQPGSPAFHGFVTEPQATFGKQSLGHESSMGSAGTARLSRRLLLWKSRILGYTGLATHDEARDSGEASPHPQLPAVYEKAAPIAFVVGCGSGVRFEMGGGLCCGVRDSPSFHTDALELVCAFVPPKGGSRISSPPISLTATAFREWTPSFFKTRSA